MPIRCAGLKQSVECRSKILLVPDCDLRLLAQQKFAELCAKHPLKRAPRLEWRPYRVSAGMAYYKLGIIGLSHIVLTTEAAVVNTLIHEYAHLLAYERFGRRGANHGPAWQAAMTELGRPAKVRHNYAVNRNAKRQEVGYECLRCGATFVRARRLPESATTTFTPIVAETCGSPSYGPKPVKR